MLQFLSRYFENFMFFLMIPHEFRSESLSLYVIGPVSRSLSLYLSWHFKTSQSISLKIFDYLPRYLYFFVSQCKYLNIPPDLSQYLTVYPTLAHDVLLSITSNISVPIELYTVLYSNLSHDLSCDTSYYIEIMPWSMGPIFGVWIGWTNNCRLWKWPSTIETQLFKLRLIEPNGVHVYGIILWVVMYRLTFMLQRNVRGSISGRRFQSPTPKPLGHEGTWTTQLLTLDWFVTVPNLVTRSNIWCIVKKSLWPLNRGFTL